MHHRPVGLLGCWVFETAESIGASLISEIRARGDALSSERRQRDDFIFQVRWIACELAESRLSLREASRLMETTATERWPMFLTYIEMIDAPGSRRTKLAYSLLLQFRSELSPCSTERLAEIAREYENPRRRSTRRLVKKLCNLPAQIL